MGSTALEIIHAAGLSITLTSPSSLTVGPAHRLTPEAARDDSKPQSIIAG